MILVQQALQEHKVQKAILAHKDRREFRVKPDYKGRKAFRENEVLKVHKG